MADDTQTTDNNAQNADKFTDIFGWKFKKKPEEFRFQKPGEFTIKIMFI